MRLKLPLFGRTRPGGAVEWLIVGLGNPGRQYALNRHNVGFHVVNLLAEENDWTFDETRNQALLARGQMEETKVALVKPQTYMNLSGQAVAGLMAYYRVDLDRLLVVLDDNDLPLGRLRLRPQGSAGGHKGLASIIEHLSTSEFCRLRIGIRNEEQPRELADFVLAKFSQKERPLVDAALEAGIRAIGVFIQDGIQAAMNQFNSITL